MCGSKTPSDLMDIEKKINPSKNHCVICGATASGNHFGVLACHACKVEYGGAFFRRSVAFKRTYICRNQRKCQIIGVPARQICRFCRIHTCLAAGMLISEVKSNGNLADSEASSWSSCFLSITELPNTVFIPQNVLGDVLRARRSIFYNRVKFGMFKSKTVSEARSQPATIHSMLHTMSVEAEVCLNFLESSKVIEIFQNEENMSVVMRHFLPTWAKMETFQNTAKQGGTKINRIYCLNEEYIDLDTKFLEDFYGVEKDLTNPQELAKIEKQYYQKMFEGAVTIAKNDLDDYEFASLVQITLIRIAREIFSDNEEIKNRLQMYLKSLLKALQKHYNENYEEGPVRMGNLVLLVGEMQQLRHSYNERVIQLDMCSVWSTGLGAYDHSPFEIRKQIAAETKNESGNLWLPCSVPLELFIKKKKIENFRSSGPNFEESQNPSSPQS